MKTKWKMMLAMGTLLSGLLCGCAASPEESRESSSAESTESSVAESVSSTVDAAEENTEDSTEETVSKAAFSCQDIDGNAFSEEIFSESKLTMVNVWATYCGPCLSEMPELGELAKEYDPEDFQLIGIISDVLENSSEDTLAQASELIEKTGADYPHLLLNESLYYALLTDVSAVPTTFFINSQGEILKTVVGAQQKSAWEDLINELLEEG